MKDAADGSSSAWAATYLEDQLEVIGRLVCDALDSLDQGSLATGLAVLGSCLLARGFALVKPLFVSSVSLALAWRVAEVAARQNHPITGGACAVAVAVCAYVLAHRVYPVVVFLLGSSAAGLSALLLRGALNLEHAQRELFALSVLVSVSGGLVLKEFRTAGWRLLTPLLGGFLLAASGQYWEQLMEGRTTWTAAGAMMTPLSAVTWSLGTLAGWYCQIIGPIFGEDPCSLPAAASRKLAQLQQVAPCLFDAEGTGGIFAARRQRGARGGLSKDFLSEPFLRGSVRHLEGRHHTRARASSRIPQLVVSFSALIVLLLNAFLIRQPLLCLGHGVLMSLAFLPLSTAGLLGCASQHRCFGPGRAAMEPILRHASHATLGVLTILCASLGCLSMYWHRLLVAEPVSPEPVPWSIRLHVYVGYAVMVLLCFASFSGAAKLVAAQGGESYQEVVPYHPLLGKLVYLLAAFNQVQGFFLGDLLPHWVAVLLTVLVVTCVAAALAFSWYSAKTALALVPTGPGPPAAADDLKVAEVQEVPRASLLGRLTAEGLTSPKRTIPCAPTSGRRRERARRDWDAVVQAFEVQDVSSMMSLCFLRWHRFAQSAQIARAHAELQSSDNLVNFLSSTLLGEMRLRESCRPAVSGLQRGDEPDWEDAPDAPNAPNAPLRAPYERPHGPECD